MSSSLTAANLPPSARSSPSTNATRSRKKRSPRRPRSWPAPPRSPRRAATRSSPFPARPGRASPSFCARPSRSSTRNARPRRPASRPKPWKKCISRKGNESQGKIMAVRYIDQDDYTVAIVGGASGIGLEAARFLSAQGASIAVLDRNKEGVASAAKELGSKATGVAVDITDWNATKSAIDSVAQQFGKIDGLVNCAAIVGKTNLPAHEV